MSRRIVLTLLDKSERGYPASLNIYSRQGQEVIQVTGLLPLVPLSLQASLQHWRSPYRKILGTRNCRITFNHNSETRFSWPEKANELVEELNDWLNSGPQSWQKMRDALLQTLSQDEQTQIFLQTVNIELQQLPWSAWDVFDRYFPATEIIFSLPEIRKSTLTCAPRNRRKLRILVVLGDHDQIDLKWDRQVLTRLGSSGADIHFFDQPDRSTFLEALWDERGWNIFYFGGHSSEGLISINQQTLLEPNKDFKHGMRKAISKGLQLAIFNSCDGLKLANALAQLSLPQSIIMREPVPDEVAQDFLAFFLTTFEQGHPLPFAVHEARRKLEDAWTYKYPGCGWLPIIFQHPDTELSTGPTKLWSKPVSPFPLRFGWWRLVTCSLVVTSLIVGVRSVGALQSWELWWFDRLLRLRPAELPDDRILIITVGESDIQYQRQNQMIGPGSLSDAALAQLLQKLRPYQPRVIGLDIYHDFEYEPALTNQLAANSSFIAPCKVSNSDTEPDGIAGPPHIPNEQLGFTDFPSDPNATVRRQLIGMTPDRGGCSTEYALSSRIVMAYLGSDYEVDPKSGDTLKVGDTLLPRLAHNAGSYQLEPASASGYQILINYRSQSPRQVSLKTILSGEIDAQLPDLVHDRIILIGPDKTTRDVHLTPYSKGEYPEKMLGVEIHAQMASQILSAVLNQRPLLWWYPEWLEWLWIYSWSFLGGAVVWRFRSVFGRSLFIGMVVISLSGICFIVLLYGGWIPLVPCALGILGTGSVLVAYLRCSENDID